MIFIGGFLWCVAIIRQICGFFKFVWVRSVDVKVILICIWCMDATEKRRNVAALGWSGVKEGTLILGNTVT